MKYKTEVIRSKDGGRREWITEVDGTEKELKKIINSINLFYEARQFKAIRITDESGKVVYEKGSF